MFENFVVKTDVFSIFAAKIHIQDAKMTNLYGAVLSALPEKPVAIDLFRIMYKSFLNTHTHTHTSPRALR